MADRNTLSLKADMDDAALTRALREALRNTEVLTIDGDLSAEITGEPDWIALLADAPTLPVVMATGPIGLRGLALLLLADAAVAGPKATWAGGDTSALASLALVRLGPVAARQFGLAEDPIACLNTLGQIRTDPDPAQVIQSTMAALAPGAAQRLRQGWRAARDLPADEALAFAAWQFTHPSKEGSDAP